MSHKIANWILLAALLLCPAAVLAQDAASVHAAIEAAKKKLKSKESRSCLVFSDMAQDQIAAMVWRMDLLGEEYQRRFTSLGGGKLTAKMNLVVFKNPEDYFATGVNKESGGVFDGLEMILFDPGADFVWHAPKRPSKMPVWHVIQHETFHLFSTAMIHKDLPGWLDEGMAEYYGCMIFSGDAFFEGDASPGDLKVVQKLIENKKMKPFATIMAMPRKDWESADRDDYEQAWSMVQYLIRGEHVKNRKLFTAFLQDVAKNKPAGTALVARYGDLKALQEKYEKYWLSLTPDTTADVLAEALTAAVTGAVARANLSGQKFDDFEQFLAALKDKTLKDKTKRPLPAEALTNIEAQAADMGKWSLTYTAGKPPKVVLDCGEARFTGTCATRPNEVVSVKVAPEAVKPPAGEKTTPPAP